MCVALKAKLHLVSARRIDALGKPRTPTGSKTLDRIDRRDLNDGINEFRIGKIRPGQDLFSLGRTPM